MKKLFAVFLSVLLLMTCVPLGAVSVSAATYGVLTYKISGGEVTITGCPSSVSGALTIPSTINGYPVTTIGDSAFSSCDSLTSVTIPDSVTTIEWYAFSSCDSLTSVTIPDSVTTIGDSAFAYCTSLTSVTIPDSVTTIGEYAFSRCTSLTSIQVNENNPNYCDTDGVLFNKSKTTLVQYPGGRPGAYAIPDSVTTIGDSAFSRCTSLTSVTIGNSVTTIGDWAFSQCTSLTSVTIGDSVATIVKYAFSSCDSLTDVYYNGSEADRENIAVDQYNDNLTNATWHYNYSPIVYGDANGDGAVNARDLAILQQYVTDWDVTIDEAAADVNASGSVNARDVALLQQYIAGWDVQLGK